MDYPWVCRGVTHEYWDGACLPLGKDVCHIDDHNDGGCKSDKFERDLTLLLKGLEEDPTNVRYMFYVAQTYHSLGNNEKAIEWYTKRAEAGGWFEEVWYSYYMIGKCWLQLRQDPKSEDKFEYWMNQAFKYRKVRSEPLYALCRYYREVGQQVKSMHYYLLGRNIPYPKDDVLFIENAVYEKYLFDYEFTILQYYIFPNERPLGLKRCVEYLNSYGYLEESVYSNVDHYIPRLLDYGQLVELNFPKQGDYTATSTALIKYKDEILANVRYVNYRIEPDGSYMMCENGEFRRENYVRTKNALIKFNKKFEQESNIIMMKEEVNDTLRRDTNILGFEVFNFFSTTWPILKT
jgi:tetratricopeptide (TPR) repeat protein